MWAYDAAADKWLKLKGSVPIGLARHSRHNAGAEPDCPHHVVQAARGHHGVQRNLSGTHHLCLQGAETRPSGRSDEAPALEAPVEETDEHGREHRSTRNRDEGRGHATRWLSITPLTQKVTFSSNA